MDLEKKLIKKLKYIVGGIRYVFSYKKNWYD